MGASLRQIVEDNLAMTEAQQLSILKWITKLAFLTVC